MSDSPELDGRTRAELLEALAHRGRQIEAMSRLATVVFAPGGVENMIRQTLTIAIEVVGAGAGSLQLHDAAQDALVFRYAVGYGAEKLLGFAVPASQGVSGQVFRSGQSNIASNAERSDSFNRVVDAQTGGVTQNMATVPIKRPGASPLGVMQIVDFGGSYDHHDLEVLEVIAGQAAIAIENARLEQQGRKAAMVNLIGDISHDIKNMLTPIQTGCWTLDPMLGEMFLRLDTACKDLSDEQRAKIADATSIAREDYGWILQNALDAAERVQNRTKEIADAVKGVSAAPRFVLADFNAVVEEVAHSLRLVAHDAQVELRCDLDATLPDVEFDRKLIYNALYNLATNALSETPEDGLVTLRTRALSASDSNFLIEILDNGRGMTPEVRASLFTDDAISTKVGGTGLGTRIVSDVVRRHRGDISVQSEVGAGTTFTLLLPLHQEK